MKRKFIAALLAMALSIVCTALPTIAQAADVETMDEFGIVGEWMWGSTIADAGEDGAEKIMARCAEMGVTDVYLLVKGTGGTLSWLETEFTENLSRTDRDVLQEAIDAAHARGIRLHAWICNMEDASYKVANPDAGMWHYIRGRDNNRINPYDEGYQEYMVKIVQELAAYDIDGIHLDYIRYNHLANGWSETDFANLEAMGADVAHVKEMIEKTFGYNGQTADSSYIFNQFDNGDEDAQLVAQYRRNNVVAYAEKIIAAAKGVNPDLIISAALQPEGSYDLSFSGLHYGQNYTDAAALYDYVTPMAYSGDFGQSSSWVAKVAKGAIDKGNKVVMGLQSYYPATSVKLMGDIEAVRSLLSDETYGGDVLGIAHFRNSQFGYAKVSYDDNNKTMSIKTINTNTTSGYQWVQVDLQEGLTAVSGAVVDGYSADTAVEVGDGYVKFSGTDILAPDGEGNLTVSYEGDLDLSKAPAVVRIYLTNESRAYNVYENVTVHPEIVSDPADQSVALGESASFTVEGAGDGELSYQWYATADLKYGTLWEAIEGATEAAYSIPATELSDDGVSYRCVVTDAFGNEVTSDSAEVHVSVPSDFSNEFEIVGEWMWSSSIYDAGEDGAEILMDRCLENGITDVYLLVKGTNGTASYLNAEVPLGFAYQDRDILQEAIDAAHARGIRLHAWICNMEDKTFKAAYEDAGMWHYIRGRDNNRINPYDERYQTYMADLVTELATNYDIDGIHLDYIRYNHMSNGWSETDFANIEAMGANIDRVKELIEITNGYNGRTQDAEYIFDQFNAGDPDAQLIFEYRRQNVMGYADKIISAAKAVDPELIISAALQPETVLDQAWGGVHYGNDFTDFAEDFDYVCPMTYTSDFAQCSTWVARTAAAAIDAGNKVVMGLQSYFPLTSADLASDIEAVRYLLDTEYADSVLGIAHFRTTQFGYSTNYYMENVEVDGEEVGVMLIHLTNPGGAYQWVQVELQDGLTVLDHYIPESFELEEGVTITNNLSTDVDVEIPADGSYIKISGTDILGKNSDGWLVILFDGEIDPTEAPSLTRIYITNESRAYNTFYDLTVEVEDPTPTDPMYRVYNPNSGEHFFTGNEEELDTLIGYGWNYEGIAFYAPTEGEPVYRVYNPNSGDHHYTMNWEEVEMLEGYGWSYEGIGWYSADSSGVPQYRLWNPNADCGSHHYTSSEEERDILIDYGWIWEGIGWYSVK